MTDIKFVIDLKVDTNISYDNWETKFETNAIVQHDSGKIGKVIYIEKLNLHVMIRVNQNTWRCAVWRKQDCIRRNMIDKWYHEDPYLVNESDVIQKAFDKLEIDDHVIWLK